MTKRRERAKAQSQLRETVHPKSEIPKSQGETMVVNGKYLLDLSKLIFAGVILTGIRDKDSSQIWLTIWGILGMVILYLFGIILVRIGNNKKQSV